MSSIGHYLNGLLEDYKLYRGLDHTASGTKPFWDAVVITSADKNQQRAFQQQIDEKRTRRELPNGLPVHIVPDPPGVRIGNGGSTLTVLEFLESKYGPDLYKMKVFLIHAGGWSQRMPSAAVLGKIFSVLPYGNPPFQMLDLKLAFYWPFVEKIKPGIFLVCADDFSVHNLGTDLSSWSIPRQGFTALAHPSPMSLGRAHGVYVLENPQDVDFARYVVEEACVEVLQKPNDVRMQSRGAVLPGDSHTFAGGIQLPGDVVYTDSCFYFGTGLVQKLLHLKKSIGELTCEIDAFGDILQSLGKYATVDYIHNTSNVSQPTDSLLETRKMVFQSLNGSDIHLLLLNASAYIHIGTTKELVDYMCRNEEFQKLLNFKKDVFNSWPAFKKHEENGSEEITNSSSQHSHTSSSCGKSQNVSEYSCIIHSSVHNESEVGPDSYIEFCDFQTPVNVVGNSIVSNCQISSTGTAPISVPGNTFLHTIPILPNHKNNVSDSTNLDEYYVTVVFNINDDLKKKVPISDIRSLPFNGSDINHYLHQRSLKENNILPENNNNNEDDFPMPNNIDTTNDQKTTSPEASDRKSHDGEPVSKKMKAVTTISLWDLKLYPSFKSMTSSSLDAISIKQGQRIEVIACGETPVFYSLSELLSASNVKGMLRYRRQLYDKIQHATSGASVNGD